MSSVSCELCLLIYLFFSWPLRCQDSVVIISRAGNPVQAVLTFFNSSVTEKLVSGRIPARWCDSSSHLKLEAMTLPPPGKTYKMGGRVFFFFFCCWWFIILTGMQEPDGRRWLIVLSWASARGVVPGAGKHSPLGREELDPSYKQFCTPSSLSLLRHLDYHRES